MTARHIADCYAAIIDTLFPARCLVCRCDSSSLTYGVCDACDVALNALCGEPVCPTCASSVAIYEVSEGLCGACRKKKPRVDGTVRVGPYTALMQPLIKAFKYQEREDLLPLLGQKLADEILRASWFSRVEAVAVVPSHWRRRLRRPFYAPSALATYVTKKCHLPYVTILRRTRCGPHQIGLSYMARLQNVHGAFALRSGVRLTKARILLIDDVKTTGATLDECSRVLRRNGAAEVYAAVVAKVQSSPGDMVKLNTV